MHPKLVRDMPYIDIKIINGRKYKYMRTSVRDGNDVRHVNVSYLGPEKPIYNVKNRRKSNSRIYAKKLTARTRKALDKLTESSDGFKRDRSRIILRSANRNTPKQIADSIGFDVRKVRYAIKAFNKRGIKALERGRARGAEQKFTKEQRAEMLMIASTEPTKLGLHFTTWSLPKLERYFVDNKIVEDISLESIRRLLIFEGMKLKKSKRFQYSNDPQFAKKN